jgi:hypothetical protein
MGTRLGADKTPGRRAGRGAPPGARAGAVWEEGNFCATDSFFCILRYRTGQRPYRENVCAVGCYV